MKIRRILLKTLIVLASVLAFIMLVFSVAIYWIVTPERVTPIVKDIAQRYIATPFEIGSVDVSIFEDFPNVSVVVDSVRISQNADSLPSLLEAGRCVVSVNPFALMNQKLKVGQLLLEDVDINLYRDSLVAPIQAFRLDTQAESDTSETSSESYALSLQGVELRGANVMIDDRLRDFYSSVDSISMQLDMEADSTNLDFDFMLFFPHISLRRQGEQLSSDDALSLSSKLVFNRDSMLLRIPSAEVSINQIQMQTHGVIAFDSTFEKLYPALEASMTTPSIDEFVRLIPSWLIDHKEKLTTQGEIKLAMNIQGEYSRDSLPRIKGEMSLENGVMRFQGRPLSVDDLDAKFEAYLDPNKGQDDSYVEIKEFSVRSSDVMDVQSSGRITRLLSDPNFNVHLRSNVNFGRLVELFPLAAGVELSGENKNDFQANFSLSHIMNQNYGRVFLDGSSSFSGVRLAFDRASYLGDSTAKGALYLDVEKGEMTFGDDPQQGEVQRRQLRARMKFTDLAFETRQGDQLGIENLALALGANLDKKTQEVTGVGGQLTMDGVKSEMRDDLDVSATKSKILLTMLPVTQTSPAQIKAEVEADSVQASSANSALALLGVDATVELKRTSKTERWSFAAGVNFDEFTIFSGLFPSFITVKDSHVSLEDRTIFLRNTHISAGESSLVATGSVSNLISTFMGENPQGKPVKGNLSIVSDQVNLSELIRITNESVLLSENQSLDTTNLEDKQQLDSLMAQEVLPLVPQNIDFDLAVNINKVLYEDEILEDFKGNVTIKKGVLSLNGLRMNALGAQVRCDMIYNNIEQGSANMFVDADFAGLQIGKLGHLYSDMDSLMPMLKDFSGEVDMQMRARTILKSGAADFDPAAINAAVKLSGHDLVLMDSETFTSLSKMLMFKNKERNLIDSLTVKMIMDSSKIKVLPFPISIDRYRAVVGGEQTVDNDFNLDYNYNISILKSPLPFKAGVDIFGNLDDYDFDITRAKLKHSDFSALDSVFVRFNNSIQPITEK